MTPTPTVTWAFLAVDGVNVQCPRALDNGVARVIGKRIDRETGDLALSTEPTRYALPKREAAALRGFFAKAVRLGHLRPADRLTAETFGVPFTPLAPTTGVTDG